MLSVYNLVVYVLPFFVVWLYSFLFGSQKWSLECCYIPVEQWESESEQIMWYVSYFMYKYVALASK